MRDRCSVSISHDYPEGHVPSPDPHNRNTHLQAAGKQMCRGGISRISSIAFIHVQTLKGTQVLKQTVRVHDNKPNTNQLKVSVSACDVVAVTQRSAQEVEASWSSGLGGKTRQLMAERVQRLQRQKDKKRYLISGWEDYPVEEKIIQIHLDI